MADPFDVTKDPNYLAAIQQGQSGFNLDRMGALADKQMQETQLSRQRQNLDSSAAQSRRKLAGNYAARGMGRGKYGAQYRAMDMANADQIAAQTNIKDQIAALNRNFLSNYGAVGTDWLGTRTGQGYQQNAIQQALMARLGSMGLQ